VTSPAMPLRGREVTSYAVESAHEVLEVFPRAHPADSRPRDGRRRMDARSRWRTWKVNARCRVGGQQASPRGRHRSRGRSGASSAVRGIRGVARAAAELLAAMLELSGPITLSKHATARGDR